MLLASAFLLISCRTELDSTHQHEQENLQKSIHNKISINDFKKETHLQTISDFSQTSTLLNKNTIDADFLKKFSIDETSIYKMDINDKQTYSLRAYNIFESPDNVYNLVYRKKNDELEFSIVKIVEDQVIPVYDSEKGVLTKVSNPSTARTCTDSYSIEIWHCKEGVSWAQCDKCEQCLYYSSGFTSYQCGGSGSPEAPGGGPGPGGNTDPGGGSGPGVYDPSGYTFDPNIPPTFDVSYIRASRASAFFNQLDYGTQVWAGQHPEMYCAVLEYYLDQLPPLGPPQNTNALILANWAVQFLVQNPDTLEPENLIPRFNALTNALQQNPNLLLDIPCGELDDWKTLANHPVPVSIKNRLFQINGQTHWYQDDFAIQNLDIASGPEINMDLFPVRITSMPYKPGTNQRYTHAEFFDFFRKNINQFAETFTPIVNSSYGINDTSLWFSNNPLGALIHIEIPGDNGTVVCSGYNSQAWIFTTIKAPITLDGLHPVSGNRLFGYSVDSNGFMYLYTRGVDRFTKLIGNSTLTYLTENFAFSKADELWKGMQTKLENYINSPQNGGLANKLESKTYRPAYSKIKDYLKNKAPLSSLGCH
jgi:hypothetical protein